MTTRPGTVIDADGRAKAYRPIPADARMAAIAEGLAAYARGDFFEAHESLEPAWMGTDDPAERAILQGLIKLAAAYVHGVRGNPTGIRKNLEGARARLLEGSTGSGTTPDEIDIDLGRLIADIDVRLVALAAPPDPPITAPDMPALPPPVLHRRPR